MEYSSQVLKQLITHKFKQKASRAGGEIVYEYDAAKVCFQLDLQIRQISNQIFKIWHKMSRIVYLDPKCIQTVLRKKHEKQVNKYFSQMVVECQNDDEEVVDSDDEHSRRVRFTIKDS